MLCLKDLMGVVLMRFTSSVSCNLASIFFLLNFSLVITGISSAQATKTEIDYTGSLLGYYRVEASQERSPLLPVQSFIDQRKQLHDAQNEHLFLGMGDNFGPEFGASIQLINRATGEASSGGCADDPVEPHSAPVTIPESLYKDDDRIAKHARCDNVLNFMMKSGFRAIVPGRQDFMYTARWLRGAARLISEESSQENGAAHIKGSPLIKNDEGQLYMLGANLRIHLETVKPEKGPDSKSESCPLLFSKAPFATDVTLCGPDKKESNAIDWLGRLDRLANTKDRTADAVDQFTEDPNNEAGKLSALTTLVQDQVAVMQTAWGGSFNHADDLKVLQKAIKSGNLTDLIVDNFNSKFEAECKTPPTATADPTKPVSLSGDNFKDMCIYEAGLVKRLRHYPSSLKHMQDTDNEKSTLPEPVREAAIRGLLRTIADEQENVGYTMVDNSSSKQKVLVIGVVGQTTMNAVSQTNLRLCQKVITKKPPDTEEVADFGNCQDITRPGEQKDKITANVLVEDPVPITAALVRAAALKYGKVDRVVVMAQMPHTDAEVLATKVWARLRGIYEGSDVQTNVNHQIDVIVSEAQAGYDTTSVTMSYAPDPTSTKKALSHPAAVLTPVTSYSPADGVFPGAISRVIITSDAANADDSKKYVISNEWAKGYDPSKSATEHRSNVTTVSLLLDVMAKLQGSSPLNPPVDSKDEGTKARTVMMLLDALQKAANYKADTVFMQSRDMLLDQIGAGYNETPADSIAKDYYGYQDYHVCNELPLSQKELDLCKLRIALDRLFWKGDYVEFVSVTGKDMKSLLKLSDSKRDEQAGLSDKDITGEWLVSYGIVQSSLSNLTEIEQNNEPLWIPVDSKCKGTASTGGGETTSQTVYCIGGTPIADDQYYWVLTTDQLAQDRQSTAH